MLLRFGLVSFCMCHSQHHMSFQLFSHDTFSLGLGGFWVIFACIFTYLTVQVVLGVSKKTDKSEKPEKKTELTD